MYLVVAATEFEMRPFRAAWSSSTGYLSLVSGVGILETALRLTSFLSVRSSEIKGVVNFGIAGAYVQELDFDTPQLLDICLAKREVLGDFGICLQNSIESFDVDKLQTENNFPLDNYLLCRTKDILDSKKIHWCSGTFITVNCATGTGERGRLLRTAHTGLCENMEGAAVARVCKEFHLPCLEIRCISNLVEDRDVRKWRLRDGCQKAGRITASVVKGL